MTERCKVCGLRMHRYGFADDYGPADRDQHNPTAIACVNGILAMVELALDEPVPMRISRSLTILADNFDKVIGGETST